MNNFQDSLSCSGLPLFKDISPGLTKLSGLRLFVSLSLPFLWCGLYFAFAAVEFWIAAIFCLAALSFTTYGSISHDLVHANLGLPRWMNHIFLTVVELLALRSGHAYRLAHLNHHARFPHDDDIEGAAAKMSLPRTLLEGVLLQTRVWIWSLRQANKDRAVIVAEGICCAATITASIVALIWTPIFFVYVSLIIMGSWVIPLVTSYIPHRADGADELHQTRRFRGKFASLIAMEHLYHLEHHLYPAVPHHHWPELARRLDPYLDAAGVKPIKFGF